MINEQRDKLINYEVFLNGNRKLGMADVTLPKIKYASGTMKGAGIGGQVDMPTLGQTESMEIEIKWRTMNGDVVELLAPKTHNLEFRSANQHYDSATGELVPEGVVVTAKAVPKEGDIGKLEPASNTDSSNTMEATYLKVEINNKKKIEIDKFNYIHYVNGTDYMAAVREILGV